MTGTTVIHCVGWLLNLLSIGNYNFLNVKEASIISSLLGRLYFCNLLEVYDSGKL